jgi:hypothetical protein
MELLYFLKYLCIIKQETMENIKTIAVIGAADKRNFDVLRELSERY